MVFLTDAVASTGVLDAITAGLQAVANDAMSAISAILPIALPIMGTFIIIGFAMKAFKKVSSK